MMFILDDSHSWPLKNAGWFPQVTKVSTPAFYINALLQHDLRDPNHCFFLLKEVLPKEITKDLDHKAQAYLDENVPILASSMLTLVEGTVHPPGFDTNSQ